jgi:hypothetical protein
MLPVLGALIGAGGSIAGGLIGANAQSEAAETNWKINLLNYYSREAERRDRINAAQTEQRDRKLGQTDANGNRVRFVEGKGWVTELSDEGQQMQDAQDQEQMRRLLLDLPARRRQMFDNIRDQNTDRYLSEGAMNALKRTGELPQEAAARMRTAAASNVNENWDNIVNSIMRKTTRTGSSGTGRILADAMKERAASVDATGTRAYMAGESQGAQNEAGRQANYLNIFNALSGRARGMPQVQYSPNPVGQNADAMMRGAASRGDDAGNQVIAAFGQKGGSMDYIEPQYGLANTVSGGAQALGGAFENIGSYYNKRHAQNSMSGTGGLY